MKGAPFISTLFVSACAAAQPAPVAYGQQAPAVRELTPAQAPRASEADWAEGEGTALSAYALRPEDAHPYDPRALPRTHRVNANETLYDIAARYQIPMLALIEQNGLEAPYALRPGSEVRLPPPRFHTVERGESFEDVARRYNVDTRSLALLNRMQAPYRVNAGERVVLPAMAQAARAAPMDPPSVVEVPAEPPSVSAGARFALPMRGPVVARFGAQTGGGQLDGIEIAGREGDRVRAAAEGEVVYAGSDVPGYGTLVLVRHADNYVTAYGFNRRALVGEGQRVEAGTPLAELGPRPEGRARLLFQVRHGALAVDPAPLLGLR
jgi:murein DD-endopeptidase MepM/ murein hydrolase activator NlpD